MKVLSRPEADLFLPSGTSGSGNDASYMIVT